jgi:hypothetical protein
MELRPSGTMEGASPAARSGTPIEDRLTRERSPSEQKALDGLYEDYFTLKGQYENGERASIFNISLRAYLDPILKAYAEKHPGFNVHYAPTYKAMFDMVEDGKAGLKCGRMHFITTNHNGHHTAWLFKGVQGRPVAIGLDSMETRNAEITAQEFRETLLERPGVLRGGIFLGTGIQKDDGSCGAVSGGFLDTFRKHPDHFDKLADDVYRMAEGKKVRHLPKSEFDCGSKSFRIYLDSAQAFPLLPPDAIKHTQSRYHIQRYFQAVPGAEFTPVTKNNETISGRLQRITGEAFPLDTADRIAMTRSADKKRLSMMNSAIVHFENTTTTPRAAESGSRMGRTGSWAGEISPGVMEFGPWQD